MRLYDAAFTFPPEQTMKRVSGNKVH